MAGSDAIIVGEGWISEHYFSTDATKESFRANVSERRKSWDDEDNEGRETPRSRFVTARQDLERDLAVTTELLDPSAEAAAVGDGRTADDVAADVHERLLDILGFTGHGLVLDRNGPLLRVSAPGVENGPHWWCFPLARSARSRICLPRDAVTLPEPVQLAEDGEEIKSVAKLVSSLFVAEERPGFVLVLAGRWALLAERERWAEGRYLAVDLQLVCERNDTNDGGEIDRALTCLSAESIAPDAEGDHLVARRAGGVGQAHGRGLEGSPRRRASVDRDHRQRGTSTAAGYRDSIRCPASEAQPLAKQSLRFLYRILFLLYAEASPELGVLPVGAPEYDQGYSLDRLRELVQVELATPQARSGTHLYESLARAVPAGRRRPPDRRGWTTRTSGAGAGAHLQPAARRPVPAGGDRAHRRGRPGQRCLAAGADAPAAEQGDAGQGPRLHLVRRTGHQPTRCGVRGPDVVHRLLRRRRTCTRWPRAATRSKGSWVVPVDRADGIDAADFVKELDPRTGEKRPVLHPPGLVRVPAGRPGTPAVRLLLHPGGADPVHRRSGPGGTARPGRHDDRGGHPRPDGVRAGARLRCVRHRGGPPACRRSTSSAGKTELGERIDPDEYPRRLQEVKAYLALHNVYGVDLNSTAVELAEISLWLDTMVPGLSAPGSACTCAAATL